MFWEKFNRLPVNEIINIQWTSHTTTINYLAMEMWLHVCQRWITQGKMVWFTNRLYDQTKQCAQHQRRLTEKPLLSRFWFKFLVYRVISLVCVGDFFQSKKYNNNRGFVWNRRNVLFWSVLMLSEQVGVQSNWWVNKPIFGWQNTGPHRLQSLMSA